MKTKIIGLAWLLVISCGVEALGFRGISVNSFLNEPLDARIDLVSITPVEAEGLRVSLADAAAFEKAGLIRPLQLSKLHFKTLIGDNQAVYIHVTTNEGVREPFLNFLLEVAWGENRLLQEYTVLLDPPFSQVTAPQQTPSLKVAKQQQAKRVVPQQESRKDPAPVKRHGPVKRSETLWVIASRTRPNRAVSVEQMMMALLQVNPDAFRHGNVNFLKQGAILDVPNKEIISKLTKSEARRAFLQQTSEWKALKRGPSMQVRAETKSQTEPVGQIVEATQAEKGLTEGGASDFGAKLSVVETGGEETVAAEKELIDEEAVISTDGKLSDEILNSRKDLEAVREINRDLVELKDALELKIEALRKSLEERNNIVDKLERRLNEMKSASAKESVQKRGNAAIVGEQQKVAGGVESEIEMGRKLVEKKPPAKPSAVESIPADWLQIAERYWLQLLVAALLLFVLILLFLLVRRRRSENNLPDPEAFGSYIEMDSQPATEERTLVDQHAARQQIDKEETGHSEGDFSPGANVDVASALTEADIYLAYRRYGQAEELIKESIGSNPENMILQAKLLEIYAFRKDRKKFVVTMEAAYQSMISRSPEIWAKVVEMGRNIVPDHELIAGASLSDEDAMANDLSFDLDDSSGSDGRGRIKPGAGSDKD